MRTLTYKRTHIGDPDKHGRFGVYDCMGQVRGYNYDAVIGVGGIGSEPRSFGINMRINWVGINPTKKAIAGSSSVVVEFETFLLLEHEGPLLKEMAPNLARRLYKRKARFLLNDYSISEQKEVDAILSWAKKQKHRKYKSESSNTHRSCKHRCKPLEASRCK